MISHLLISEKKRITDKYVKDNFLGKNVLFFEMSPATKKYSIAEVKQVLGEIKIYNPQKRVFYFPSFDASSLEAQNAMLKVLEEPPEGVLFVLTSSSVSRLLPTIVSRTKIIKLGKAPEPVVNEKIFTALKNMLEKKDFAALDFDIFTCKTSVEAIALSDQIVLFFRQSILTDKNSPLIIKEILRLRALLENNNITPQMTIDHILIFISKTYTMKL
jgi:DNA polymerase III delta prime subunit